MNILKSVNKAKNFKFKYGGPIIWNYNQLQKCQNSIDKIQGIFSTSVSFEIILKSISKLTYMSTILSYKPICQFGKYNGL